MNDYKYITDEDIKDIEKFCSDKFKALFGTFDPNSNKQIWHYTGVDGLDGILKEREIWGTQASCLNDNMESVYFAHLIKEKIREKLPDYGSGEFAKDLQSVYRYLDELSLLDDQRFFSCFSECEDDLGQWRGYGGGKCGYAIGFTLADLFQIAKEGKNTYFFPVLYAQDRSDFINRIIDFFSPSLQKKTVHRLRQFRNAYTGNVRRF